MPKVCQSALLPPRNEIKKPVTHKVKFKSLLAALTEMLTLGYYSLRLALEGGDMFKHEKHPCVCCKQ